MTPFAVMFSVTTSLLAAVIVVRSLHDAIAEMRDAVPLDDERWTLELDGSRLVVGEKGRAVAQDHRDEVDADLVEEPGLERLARHLAAVHRDVLVACDLPGLRHGVFDAAGDEDEVVVGLWSVLGRLVRQDDRGHAQRMAAVPRVRQVVEVESHDERATAPEMILDTDDGRLERRRGL